MRDKELSYPDTDKKLSSKLEATFHTQITPLVLPNDTQNSSSQLGANYKMSEQHQKAPLGLTLVYKQAAAKDAMPLYAQSNLPRDCSCKEQSISPPPPGKD